MEAELLLEDPLVLAENKELCTQVIDRLDDPLQCQAVINWLCPAVKPLALARESTRVVQKALEVVQGEGKTALLREISPHTLELIDSPHGNFVITKVVEMMPSPLLGGFIEKVMARGAETLAKQRFGCRLLERLVEHCSENELRGILDEIVANANTLCRHQYGNFVVQTILEHGSQDRRRAVVEKLLVSELPVLAMHRTASHVVQKALGYSDKAAQDRLIQALLETMPSPLEVACSRYGSFVFETMGGIRPQPAQVRSALSMGLAELGSSINGRRVAVKFGLEVPPGEVVSEAKAPDEEGEATPDA